MKKLSFIFILSLLFANTFALEVDEPEIRSVANEPIEFINYTGPHKVIDSIEAIKGIGSELGKNIIPNTPSSFGSKEKYYVIHAVDPNESGKLDADIIFIGKSSSVDHIKNLRRIISAYLSTAYGYSESDADTLAVFITVYNAVYRGNYDIFKSKYKDVVTKNLSTTNCGLSVNYKDWPGQSEIIIPLFDVNDGGLSTVDTSVISDSNVVDSMQEESDKNVDDRKNMVDIKEREAEDASEKAQEAQKKATEEQNKLNESKVEAQEAQNKANEAKKEAEKNPTTENKKVAEEAQKVADEKQEEVKEQEKKTEEAKEEAAEKQQIADKKINEAQNERNEIAKDQQEVQQREAEEARMPSEYGIILSDQEELLSRLVKFNTETGEIIKKSPVSEIRNRTIYENNEEFIAVAGVTGGNATIKLVTIDSVNMEITSESNETIAADSVLVKDGNYYYCVIEDGEKWVIGQYDSNLILLQKSQISVLTSTPITITKSGVVVTDSKGRLRLLSSENLVSITKEESENTGNLK